jgi:hypothetical protein
MNFRHRFTEQLSGSSPKGPLSPQMISMFIGVLIAAVLIGPSAIWPTRTAWLHSGDAAAAQIAWNYFRHTPLMQWPPTLIPDYGTGWSTYFTGAGGNVLVGLPLKLFNFILPNNFQYIGLWMVVCFALQGYFAAKILALFISSRSLVVLLSTNFVIAPVFVYRIGLMSHPQLGAQWLLLCAVYFFLKRDKNVWHWSLLVAVSHLIEIYMSAVILLVVFSFFVSKFISQSGFRDRVAQLKYVFFPFLTSGFVLWLLGFFAYPDGVKGDGFFRFGATTFIDPRTSDSSSSSLIFNSAQDISNHTSNALVGESFMYLGTGTLLAVLLSAGFLFKYRWRINHHHVILLLLGMLLFLVGLSRVVSVGPFEFSYWWPSFFDNARQIFRAATRFGWLLYYLVFIALSVIVGRLAISAERRLALVGLLLTVNALDQSPLYASTFAYYRNEPQSSIWFDPVIHESLSRYSAINFYPVFDLQEDKSTDLESEAVWRESSTFMDVLRVSSELNLKTNFAYQSRSVGDVIEKENSRLRDRIRSGMVGRGELFAFSNAEEQINFAENCSADVLVFSFGGVYFVGLST